MNKFVLLFPGQGSQYVGMGKHLYHTYSIAKRVFEEASDCCGFDMAKLCFEGDNNILSQTQNTQPAVLTVGYASAKVLMEEYNYNPSFMAGHSLGEITALTSAGAIEFHDAVRFVKLRGQLMQEAADNRIGAMSAIIGLEPFMVKQICNDISNEQFVVEVSNYNAPTQTVISGHKEAVSKVEEYCTKYSAKAIPLNVSAPFHCSLMKPAAAKLEITLKNMQFGKLKIPVLSNVTGAPYINEKRIADLLTMQLTNAVEWVKIMKFLYVHNIFSFIDVGPGNIVQNLTNSNIHGARTISFDKEEAEIKETKDLIKHNEVSFKKLEFIRKCMGIVISTKNHSKKIEEYENMILSPYQLMKRNYNTLVKDKRTPEYEDIVTVFNMLCSILKHKEIPEGECCEIVSELLEKTDMNNMLQEVFQKNFNL